MILGQRYGSVIESGSEIFKSVWTKDIFTDGIDHKILGNIFWDVFLFAGTAISFIPASIVIVNIVAAVVAGDTPHQTVAATAEKLAREQVISMGTMWCTMLFIEREHFLRPLP